MDLYPLIGVLLALQFAAFGWRINREIPLGDEGRRTWFPIPDFINMAALISVVLFCVIRPVYIGSFTRISRTAIAVGFVLIAFHPITMAAHYRLFSKTGRSIYLKKPGDDYPYATGQEIVMLLISAVFAIVTGYLVYHAGGH